MITGGNNKLANVPTITGLSTIDADIVNSSSVDTDTLTLNGVDVGDQIAQIPINTAAIAALQQVTTGQSYDALSDTTTFDNNVTLTTGKTMTATNFTGLASNATRIEVAATTSGTTFFPVFSAIGAGQKELRFNISGTPLSYVPSTNTLNATTFSGNATTATIASRATNIDGGIQYQIPYQSNVSTTSFLPNGTSGQVLQSNGVSSAPSWITPSVPATPTLAQVLVAGNSAGSNNINMNSQSITSATNITATNLSATNTTTTNINLLTAITPSNSKSVLFNGTPIGNGGNTSSICMGTNAGPVGICPNNSFLFGTNSGANLSSGVQNLCIGPNSGNQLNTGRNNTFLGGSAGRKTTTGTYNTQIGSQSQSYPDENLTGSYNTTIGADCYILNDGLSYSTAIGARVEAKTSNTVQIGRSVDNTVFDGTVTLNNNLLLTSPATTLTPTELSYLDGATSNIQAQIDAINPANFVTTNTVQNITANKTMYGASLLIDDGSGDNCTVSQTNQITHMKSNILQNTITVTGIVPIEALNTVVVTDGTNPNIVANQIITGGSQPLLPDWIVSSATNYTMNVTTQGMPVGQVQLVNAVPLGTFFTSGIGTNFVAGTYITALVVPASLIYSISINALNTTLFKVSHTLKNITTSITKASAIGTSTFIFSYEGTLRVYDKTSGGVDEITMSISNTNSYIASPNLLMDTFYVGTGNTRNNVIIGTAVPSQTRFSLGNNTIVGNNSGNVMGNGAVDNTCIGYNSLQNLTSGNSCVCAGSNSGAGITTASQCVFIGMNAGYQTAGTGNGNTAVGYDAGNGLLTSASNNTLIGSGTGGALSGLANTFLGVNSGANVTSGSENICIGNGSVTTAATSSNQISIGRTSETMYIQGGFNYRVLNITATGNITFPFPQFFTLTLAGAITLTLPTVNIAHRGAVLKFKRNTGAFLVTITTTGGTALVFKAFNSVGAFTANATLPAANFYTDLICDGSGWYQLTRT